MEKASPGIAFYGHLFSYTGYATATRAYIHAFHSAAIDMSVFDLDAVPVQFVPDPLVSSYQQSCNNPVLHLCHAMPQELRPLQKLRSRLIVLTTWEADALPQQFIEPLNQVLEVWVPSRYNLETFQRHLRTPVFQLPHPAHEAHPCSFSKEEINKQLQIDENTFLFLTMGTWQERKNLPGVIEAFLRAFPSDPRAVLVIKTSFTFVSPSQVRAQILEAVQWAHPPNVQEATNRIKICATFWPEESLTALAQRANCYVSLHRGEGWCYPLFDAACNGTPVISTAYSGPMDYLEPRYHHLVPFEPVAAGQQQHVAKFAFTDEMSWAEPDIAQAAALMRQVYDHREDALERAAKGALLLRKKYSMEAIGEMARQRLNELSIKIGGA